MKFSAESLLGIVNQVLDFSKIDAGKMELCPSIIPLAGFLKECLELAKAVAIEKNLEFALDLAPDLPARILVDPLRLRQILLNLLGNAVKFTFAGAVRVSVSASQATHDSYLLNVTVSDTGIGIPEDKLQAIFERFSQADASPSRQFGGTGLGLAITRGLLELMNGKIWAESRLGEGSRFHFSAVVGLCEAADADAGEVTPAEPPPSGCARKRCRILVAEDNRVNQLVIERMLTGLGYSPVLANNGREAVERLSREQFDLLITDIQMPEMDGTRLATVIRQKEKLLGRGRLPILGLTAHAFLEDQERCLAAGMDGYLTKPARVRDLEAKIAELTGPVIVENRPA